MEWREANQLEHVPRTVVGIGHDYPPAFERFELIREWLQRIGTGLPFMFDHGEIRIFFSNRDRHGERRRRPSIDMQAIHETGLS